MKASDATKFQPSPSCDSCDATSFHAEKSRPVIAQSHPTAVRYSLGGLLTFGALNALGGGYYGLTGAVGVPTCLVTSYSRNARA